MAYEERVSSAGLKPRLFKQPSAGKHAPPWFGLSKRKDLNGAQPRRHDRRHRELSAELAHTITDEEVIEMFEEWHGGIEPLESNDIAESILYVVTAPDRVDVEELMVLPSD